MHRNRIWICLLVAFVLLVGGNICQAARQPRAIPDAFISPPSAPRGLDDPTDTLFWDNENPADYYYFSYPDPDGDSLFNVRFLSPDTCKLLGAWFMLFENGSYGTPDFGILVWNMGADSFPNEVLGGDTLAWSEIDTFAWSEGSTFHPAWCFFDLSHLGIRFRADQWFHIGFTGIRHAVTDTIALISDDGIPGTPYSILMWRGDWHTIQELYVGVGYNLLIRALVDVGVAGVQILEPAGAPSAFHLDAPYPNPFNPTTTLLFSVTTAEPVQLTINDLLGRTIATLIQGHLSPGSYSITVDGSAWPSGIYFANLVQGRNRQVVRLVLMK